MSFANFTNLTFALPDAINLHEAQAVLDDLEHSDRLGDLDEEEGEQLDSLRALKDELSESWAELTHYGGSLISQEYWGEYAQMSAYDFGMVEEGSAIEPYVDWSKWADAMRTDYEEITVESGIFAGTWFYRL